MRTISGCEVCGHLDLQPLLDLGAQPLCDDLVPIGSDRRPSRYPIQLDGCPACFTVHQRFQVEPRLLFPPDYHYRAAMTGDVLAGMADLVDDLEQELGSLAGLLVLDVGCNDGSLLAMFRARGAVTAGIEPTQAAEDARARADWIGHGFFDAAMVDRYLQTNRKPDVITFTNVFAHIEDLRALIANVRALLGPGTRVVIENHYLGAVVQRFQFDTFYHEHPRTYSARALGHIADRMGLRLERLAFPPRYNGNIRAVIGPGATTAAAMPDESRLLSGVAAMRSRIAAARERLHEWLDPMVEKCGPVPAKAFPGRAAILVHCLGLDERHVDVTYERSASLKVGHYVPGTRIEISDEADFVRRRIGAPTLLNFAWHIPAEIERDMRALGYRGAIIPVCA